MRLYLFEHDDSLLIVLVGGDIKHGSSISRDDVVFHLCVLSNVQIMSFDSANC